MTNRRKSSEKNGLKKGPWSPEEDKKLIDYIDKYGHGKWRILPENAGLKRCGKSCRLRWTNYLRPDIKRGKFSSAEEDAIIQLHCALGNKWSTIAANLPGRTDNEIKNYWNTHIKKKLVKMGIDPMSHTPRLEVLQLASILNSYSHTSPQFNNQNIFDMGRVTNPNHLQLLNLVTTLLSCQNKNISISNDKNHQNQFNDKDNANNNNNDSISLQNFHSSIQENQCTMELESQLIETNLENQVSLRDTSFSQQHAPTNLWQCLLSDIEQPELSPLNNVLENHILSNNEEMSNFNLSSLFSPAPSSSSLSNLNSQFPTTSINGATEDERDTYNYDNNLFMYNNIQNDFRLW